MQLGWRRVSDWASPPLPVGNAWTPPAPASGQTSARAEIAAAMIDSDRSALLLRPKLACDVERDVLESATKRFHESVCFVPAGRVQLRRWQVDVNVSSQRTSRDVVSIDAIYLQRNTVTNDQFQAFLVQGGYENRSLWQASVWPCVREFVDRTGKPGPRFWSDGRYLAKEAEHPVVGVNWFEAEAYARWIGMRLPSDAEWVRAASSPIDTGGALIQRKYPWGDSFVAARANLWASGMGHTQPVSAHAEGDSLGGARQMIGNVWEWTVGDLQLWNGLETLLPLAEPMKNLRGAAFDSFMDVCATCECQSADNPLARRHNIGFRCVVSVGDILSDSSQADQRIGTQCEDSRKR